MAMLERRLKQRIVGAAVLLALMVVFLPMLFNREDDQRRVRVEAPPMPAMPAPVVTPSQSVAVPEPQPEVVQEGAQLAPAGQVQTPSVEQAAPSPVPPPLERGVQTQPPAPQAAPAPAQPAPRLDVDGLPVAWSVQLASLSSRARAEELQQKLRAQGHDAYIRSVDGMNRVFVGPLLERADAERVREQIARQLRLSPIVVRFQPERR